MLRQPDCVSDQFSLMKLFKSNLNLTKSTFLMH